MPGRPFQPGLIFSVDIIKLFGVNILTPICKLGRFINVNFFPLCYEMVKLSKKVSEITLEFIY